MKTVILSNDFGKVKSVKIGFCWTMAFFGPMVSGYRHDLKGTGIYILSSMVSLGLAWVVFPFIYNKMYLKDLLANGYTTTSVAGTSMQAAELKLQIKLQ
jgi:hypothetical protein